MSALQIGKIHLIMCISLIMFSAGAFELRRGEAVSVIMPPDPLPVERLSAEILKDGLRKSLGLQFRSGAPVSFLIGRAAVQWQKLKYDEYRIVIGDHQVSLFGGDDSADPLDVRFRAMTGTLYAVSRFLRDYCSMAWLWPGELGECIFPRDRLVLLGGAISGCPRVPVRDTLYSYANLYTLKFKRKFVLWGRLNGLGNSISGAQAGHSDERILGNRYFASHPEYYALVKGKRSPMSKFSKICYSSREVAGIYTEYILSSSAECVSISPNDGHSWCECPACLKANSAGAGGAYDAHRPNASGSVFLFANRIARELKRRGSDKKITLFAYEDYVYPPRNIDRLEDNIILFLARGISWLNDAAEKKNYDRLLQEWSRRSSRIVIRDYRNNMGPMIINAYPRLAYDTLRNLYEQTGNFCGLSLIGDDTCAFALWGPTAHVYNTLLWEGPVPLKRILDHYYLSGWPASHFWIRKYFDYFEDTVNQAVKKCRTAYTAFDTAGNIRILLEAFSKEKTEKGEFFLEKAMAQAATEEERARIEFLRVGLEAVKLDERYYRALVRLASSGQMLLHIPVFAEYRSVDTAEAAKEVILAEERRRAFLIRYQEHDGIPARALLRRRKSKEPDLQEIRLLAAPPEHVEIVKTPWKFCTDPDHSGEQKGWHLPEFDDGSWNAILSGSHWEQQGYGQEKYGKKSGYDGWAWYRQLFDLRKDETVEDVILHLGAVDESCIVFVNGRKVMEYYFDPKKDPSGWKKKRSVSIGKEIQNSRQTLIAVAVHDSAGMGGIWKHVTLEKCYRNLLPPLTQWKSQNLSLKDLTLEKKEKSSHGSAAMTLKLENGAAYHFEFLYQSVSMKESAKIPKVTLTLTDLKTGRKLLHGSSFNISVAPGDIRKIREKIIGTGNLVRVRLLLYADGAINVQKMKLEKTAERK